MSAATIHQLKQQVIGAGFAFLKATSLHRRLSPLTRGQGAILTLHHVRPWQPREFAPNRLLEVTPDFLDAALARIKGLGFELVAMDEALRRIGTGTPNPFVTLTFDDGYIDNIEHALPVLERHAAPFTLFVTSGYADRRARLWWLELEEAFRALDRIDVDLGGQCLSLAAASEAEKAQSFRTLYWLLRQGPEDRLLDVIGRLLVEAGIDGKAMVGRLCLDWTGIVEAARHPLCTIGAHTMTHPMLAKHDAGTVWQEMSKSRRAIEMRTGLPVRHLSYPVGDPTSAGPREFAIAAELGFASAVTTRPGMLFPEHRERLTALPRISLNGNWQSLDSLDVLLSGVPFAVWNRGRLVA